MKYKHVSPVTLFLRIPVNSFYLQFLRITPVIKVPIRAPDTHRPPLIRNIKAIRTNEEIPAIAPTSLISAPMCEYGRLKKTTRIATSPPRNPESVEIKYPFLTTSAATRPENRTRYHIPVYNNANPRATTITNETTNPTELFIFIDFPPPE
jgi:hypothetical protein